MAKRKQYDSKTRKIFSDDQREMFDKSLEQELEERSAKQVECLGMTFSNDEERRKHFLEKLREKLKDPEFRKIEGFPIGSDEDILALSDPPYYTACPNPFIADFITQYGKPYDPKIPYSREPFAADVSEGKNDLIYNAHSYHTKVPHKAIMRYILHYTEPGDLLFDGFCGTGMTGVAAKMCGDKAVVESLGYRVDKDGTISQQETDENGKDVWRPFSKLGARQAVLNDLSPSATFIAQNYNTPVDVEAFKREAKRILKEVDDECGWMYETLHVDGKAKGKINYVVWSDVFVCPECTREIIFWEAAVDKKVGAVLEDFKCPHCEKWLSKSPANPKKEADKPPEKRRPLSSELERAKVSKFDKAINQTIRQAKQVPVIINYTIAGKRAEKKAEKSDLALIEKIERSDIPYWFPDNRMMEGGETRRNDPIGLTHVHHFYTKRNLWVLAKTLSFFSMKEPFGFVFSSMVLRSTIMNRIVVGYHFNGGGGANGAHLKGTMYVSSLPTETPVPSQIKNKSQANVKVFSLLTGSQRQLITTQSMTKTSLPESSMDYLFLDPPFGSNLNYSELNFLWESWLKVWTNIKPEAIENSQQGKGPNEYRHLMTECFKEAYRLLKPGRWMTVEFSNTKASVWNSIQTALTEAGFIVANVSALDKQQGSFKAVTTPTAVKQDLIISAYKPNGGFEERFQKEAQTEEGVWDFVRTHLKYLTVTKLQGELLQMVPERDPRILFDQMVAFYVRKDYPVPISSQEFQVGLAQRFIQRDGMYFLPEQVPEYDRKRMQCGELYQNIEMFVKDEGSMIDWLRQLLAEKPQTFSDINPKFMQQLGGWSKNETLLDLRELLEQNFLCYDGKGLVPEQIHCYLSTNWKEMRKLPKDDPTLRTKGKDRWYVPDPNKAGDLEKLRDRALLKEFEEYRTSTQKRLKVFRLEAVRTGFKRAWQERDYVTIITVARKIPENILQEDQKLLMWYDHARTRKGEDA